jgi:allophanate hydrolase subunit 2
MTEEQVRNDLESQLKELTAQAEVAVADGMADQKLLTNAQRMKKIIKSLKKAEVVADLTNKQQQRFAKSSVRVQKACDRAGYPLPEDNTVARTAAGI